MVSRAPRRAVLRALAAAVVGGLLGLVVVFATPSVASAHATVKSTDPAAGTILDTGPAAVTITFSEGVDPVADRVDVLAPDGKSVVDGAPDVGDGGTVLRIPLRADLGDGSYLVSYRVISADGHPVSGGFTFSVRVPSAVAAGDTDAAATSGSAEVDPGVRAVQSTARYAGYAGLALLAGPLLILATLWPRRLATRGPRRLAWTGWGLLAGGTLVTLVLQQPYAAGGSLADVSLSGLTDTSATTVGTALVARLVILLAAVPVLVRAFRRAGPVEAGRGVLVDRILLGLLGAATLFTFPYAGHGGQTPVTPLSVPALALHVGAMAVWLGGLAVLARYLLPRAKFRELSVVLPTWSRWASIAVAVLVLTGLVETVVEIGGVTETGLLFSTPWGQLVMTKVIWLVAILVVAANARAWVRRRFSIPVAYAFAAEARSADPKPPADPAADFSAAGKSGPEVRRLRTRVAIELLLGAVVLALATALVQVAPARTAGDEAALPNVPYSARIATDLFVLQLDISPADAGPNSVHVTAYDQQGLPVEVLEWSASAELKSARLTVDIELLPITNNHAVGQTEMPIAGDWTVSITARVSDIDQETVTRTVRIR